MSASVTSTVSVNGLLSLDIIFTAPGALVLRRLRILCNGELVCYVQPREWITVDGTGKLAISYLGPTYSGRHVAHVPLTMYPNTTLAFSVNADYLTYANWNAGIIEQTDTCPDVVVANTFNVPGNVIGPTIFPVGAIVAPITLTFDAPLTIDSAEVPVTVFAEDDNAVTGYVVTATAAPPYANDPRWAEIAPTSYTLSSPGAHTLYAWAKDADGNVSDAVSAAVTATFTPSNIDATVAATGTEGTAQTGAATASGSGITQAAGSQAAAETGTALASSALAGSAATGFQATAEAGTATATGSGVVLALLSVELNGEYGTATASSTSQPALTPAFYLRDQQGRMFGLRDNQGRIFALRQT